MSELEIPKPVGIAIATTLAILILGLIWWSTGTRTTGDNRDWQGDIARQEAQQFRATGSPTTTLPASEMPPRD